MISLSSRSASHCEAPLINTKETFASWSHDQEILQVHIKLRLCGEYEIEQYESILCLRDEKMRKSCNNCWIEDRHLSYDDMLHITTITTVDM